MQAVKMNSFRRHWITLRIVFQHALGRLATAVENVGALFYHLTIYQKRCGYIELGVEDEDADGRLRLVSVDEFRRVQFEEVSFRIYNRWLVRNMRRCSSRVLWQIKTDVMTQDGLNVHSVLWGNQPHRSRELKPFDLSRLPPEHVIAQRNARLKRWQDWLARHFPARQIKSGLTIQDAAEAIIIR